MSKSILIAVMSLTLMSLPALSEAQESNQAEKREKPSAKMVAEARTKQLEKELQLTPKQYKKVYSLCLQEQKLIDRLMDENAMGGPGGNGGPGMGGPGNGRPGGNGGPGMGGPGNGRPPKIDIENDPEMKAFQKKKEKKMRKILSEEQFYRWESMQM